MSTKPIPVSAARNIAQLYDYDQVIVVARKVGDDGMEHVTTYGRDKAHCAVAARTGDFLKHKIMGWPEYTPETAAALSAAQAEVERLRGALECLLASQPTANCLEAICETGGGDTMVSMFATNAQILSAKRALAGSGRKEEGRGDK